MGYDHLSHLELLTFFNIKLGIFVTFCDNDDGRAHLESASHAGFLEREAICIVFEVFLKVVFVEGSVFIRLEVALISVVWISGNGFIGVDIIVKVKLDASDVGGANSTLKVESLLPPAKNIDTLVIFEDIFVLVHVRWLNRAQVSNDVSSVVGGMDGWRVEPVIITWRQIDHHIEKLIASCFDFIDQRSDLLNILLLFLFWHVFTEHEFIKLVGPSLDTINRSKL